MHLHYLQSSIIHVRYMCIRDDLVEGDAPGTCSRLEQVVEISGEDPLGLEIQKCIVDLRGTDGHAQLFSELLQEPVAPELHLIELRDVGVARLRDRLAQLRFDRFEELPPTRQPRSHGKAGADEDRPIAAREPLY